MVMMTGRSGSGLAWLAVGRLMGTAVLGKRGSDHVENQQQKDHVDQWRHVDARIVGICMR